MLFRSLIRAYTNPQEVVLDCFSGSGSTAIAAVNTNRKFVGCELDSDYFEKSIQRINEMTGTTVA